MRTQNSESFKVLPNTAKDMNFSLSISGNKILASGGTDHICIYVCSYDLIRYDRGIERKQKYVW